MSSRLHKTARRETQAKILDIAARTFDVTGAEQVGTIAPDRLRIIAETIRPGPSDNWLAGFEIAVAARPNATEALLLAAAPFIDAEAIAFEHGVAAGWAAATIELERRKGDLHAELDAKLRAFAAEITGDPDLELESLRPKARLN